MPAKIVRSDYDQLKQISKGFSSANSAVASTNRSVNSAMQQLKGGDWIGEGARAFYKEMESDVMPSMKRLEKAMAEAAKITNQIAKLVKQAEDDSSRLFRL